MIFVFVVVGKIEVRHLILESLYFPIKVWAAWHRVCLFIFCNAPCNHHCSFPCCPPRETQSLLRTWATIFQVLLCKWGTPGIVHLRAYLFFCVWSTHFSTAQFKQLRNGWRRRASCCALSRWPLTEKDLLDMRWENVSWKSVVKVILNIMIDKIISDDCRSMLN